MGWQRHSTAVSRGRHHQKSTLLHHLFLNMSSHLRPLAGKTITDCKVSDAECYTVLVNITGRLDDARHAKVGLLQAQAGVQLLQ